MKDWKRLLETDDQKNMLIQMKKKLFMNWKYLKTLLCSSKVGETEREIIHYRQAIPGHHRARNEKGEGVTAARKEETT